MSRSLKIRIPIYLGVLAVLAVFKYHILPRMREERLKQQSEAPATDARASGSPLSGLTDHQRTPDRDAPTERPTAIVDDNLLTLPPPVRAAAEEARATVETFRRLLEEADAEANERGEERGGTFSLLVQLREGEEHERFWLEHVTWKDGTFHGRTESMPRYLRTIGARYPVQVRPEEIFDWVVKRKGTPMEGAFTAVAWSELQQATPPSRDPDADPE